MTTYKEITPEEADALWRAGCEFQCVLNGRARAAQPEWQRWVWNNLIPSNYFNDLFRVEVE